jgi:hypothetical protein
MVYLCMDGRKGHRQTIFDNIRVGCGMKGCPQKIVHEARVFEEWRLVLPGFAACYGSQSRGGRKERGPMVQRMDAPPGRGLAKPDRFPSA